MTVMVVLSQTVVVVVKSTDEPDERLLREEVIEGRKSEELEFWVRVALALEDELPIELRFRAWDPLFKATAKLSRLLEFERSEGLVVEELE